MILSVWGLQIFLPLQAWAQAAGAPTATGRAAAAISWSNLLASIVYGVLGMGLLLAGYYFYELITPYSVRKELIEDQNIALGIVVAAIILGMALIIAAAIL